jgi:hypothetical protein
VIPYKSISGNKSSISGKWEGDYESMDLKWINNRQYLLEVTEKMTVTVTLEQDKKHPIKHVGMFIGLTKDGSKIIFPNHAFGEDHRNFPFSQSFHQLTVTYTFQPKKK